MSVDFLRQKSCAAAFLLLFLTLGGLFVGAGTITANPAMNSYPNEDNVIETPDDHLGDKVVFGGIVVETDPVTVEVEPETGDTIYVTFENVDQPLSVGDEVIAFGTLQKPQTLDVDRAVIRAPWEFYYMYIVSFIGGLWVLVRILLHWRFDFEQLAFVSQEDGDA
jgi:hypothetical protein